VIPIVAISLYFLAEPKPVVTSDNSAALAPLQISLEALADERLAGDRVRLDSNHAIVLNVRSSEEIDARAKTLLATARRAGATVIETGTESVRRWSVMLPAARAAAFREALTGEDLEFETETGVGDSEILSVEIRVEAAPPTTGQ
jgi:uncharacterized membrane protein